MWSILYRLIQNPKHRDSIVWTDRITIFIQIGQVIWNVQAELRYTVKGSVAEPNCTTRTLTPEFCKERHHRIQLSSDSGLVSHRRLQKNGGRLDRLHIRLSFPCFIEHLTTITFLNTSTVRLYNGEAMCLL